MTELKFKQNQVASTIFTLHRPLQWFMDNSKDASVKALFQKRLDEAVAKYGSAAAEEEAALDRDQVARDLPSTAKYEAQRCELTVIEHVDDYGVASCTAGQA
jgi:hypothetical protein